MAKRKKRRAAPRSRRRVGATSTETLLYVGLGLAAVYLLTRPKTVTPPLVTYPAGYLPASTNTPLNTAITTGGSVLNNLINNLT